MAMAGVPRSCPSLHRLRSAALLRPSLRLAAPRAKEKLSRGALRGLLTHRGAKRWACSSRSLFVRGGKVRSQNHFPESSDGQGSPLSPDVRLIEQLRNADPEAGHRFFRECYPSVYRYLLWLTG